MSPASNNSWPRPLTVVHFSNYRNWRAYSVSSDGEILEWGLGGDGKWWGPNELGFRAPEDATLHVDAFNDGSLVPGSGNIHIRITWADGNGNLTNIAYDEGKGWEEHRA